MNNKLWISVILILFSANVLIISGAMISNVRTQRIDAMTDKYEDDRVVMADANKRTIMTHLYTMDTFLDIAEEMFEKNEFPPGVVAMISFDGDGMGKINENYGSGAADRMCYAFADVVKKHFPDSEYNIVTNVGEKSDEFYMLLLGRESKEEVEQEIKEFQEDIRKIVVKADDLVTDVKGTVSVGIAFYDGNESFESFFDSADSAAYKAKEAGKDCYRIAE